MRGDPPLAINGIYFDLLSTPHARGSTAAKRSRGLLRRVYPACAGIHLDQIRFAKVGKRLPRMRGDPPPLRGSIHTLSMSTPHARGSTVWVP